MTDRNKTNKASLSDYLKAIIGAAIFLTVGVLLTSNLVNLSENRAILLLQCFSLGLVLIAISFKGYYFSDPDDKAELPGKFLLFSVVLIPTSLIFFVNESYRELFFFISFFISICFMLIHEMTFKREEENYILTFLTSVWVLLSAIVFVKNYRILPVEFFNELSFLQLDTIQTIKIVLLIGLGFYIVIISFVEAIKPENIILEPYPFQTIPLPTQIESYHVLLQPFLWLAWLAIIFLNIGIHIINFILAALRIIFDFFLRLGWQIILSVIKLFYGFRSIIFFLFLYLAAFSIPFIIKVNSPHLLSYIRGYSLDFYSLLFQIGILLLAIFIFRLLVTFQFCEADDSSYDTPIFERKAYVENFIPIIYCIVFYAFFISLSSIVLTGLSNYWNSVLLIQGYSSIGTMTKYTGYMIGIAILIVVPFIIFKSKLSKNTNKEDKSYYVFAELEWSTFWNKSWVLLLFPFLFLVSYFYTRGTFDKWFYEKTDIANPQSIDSTKVKSSHDSLELINAATDTLRNDSMLIENPPFDLVEKQEEQKSDSIPPTVKTYSVQPHEGLYAVARKFGVTVAQLREWNNLTSDTLKIGQKLIISK